MLFPSVTLKLPIGENGITLHVQQRANGSWISRAFRSTSAVLPHLRLLNGRGEKVADVKGKFFCCFRAPVNQATRYHNAFICRTMDEALT